MNIQHMQYNFEILSSRRTSQIGKLKILAFVFDIAEFGNNIVELGATTKSLAYIKPIMMVNFNQQSINNDPLVRLVKAYEINRAQLKSILPNRVKYWDSKGAKDIGCTGAFIIEMEFALYMTFSYEAYNRILRKYISSISISYSTQKSITRQIALNDSTKISARILQEVTIYELNLET